MDRMLSSVYLYPGTGTFRKRQKYVMTFMGLGNPKNSNQLLIYVLSMCYVINQSYVYANECIPLSTLDSNDLTVADITIKHQINQLICVRAKFALAFNIEELVQRPADKFKNITINGLNNQTVSDYVHVGYLPIGLFKRVELNCPDTDDHYNKTSQGLKSFLMMADFGCGTFKFTFVRDDISKKYFQSNLQGTITFGKG